MFAIAITLLVLTLEIPGGVDDLGQELRDRAEEFFAYGLSFAVLGKFWITHHSFFGSLARFDARLMALNLLYLAFIALVPFTSDLLGDYSDQSVAVIIYALNMAAITGIFAATVRYSLRHELIREWAKPHTRRFAGWTEYTITVVFLISCPIALAQPPGGDRRLALDLPLRRPAARRDGGRAAGRARPRLARGRSRRARRRSGRAPRAGSPAAARPRAGGAPRRRSR